jgi:hypothetical protein
VATFPTPKIFLLFAPTILAYTFQISPKTSINPALKAHTHANNHMLVRNEIAECQGMAKEGRIDVRGNGKGSHFAYTQILALSLTSWVMSGKSQSVHSFFLFCFFLILRQGLIM